MTTLYIVEALRYGDRELHSYVAGVFSTMELASKFVKIHDSYRGGKYDCTIQQVILDHIDQDELTYFTECCVE